MALRPPPASRRPRAPPPTPPSWRRGPAPTPTTSPPCSTRPNGPERRPTPASLHSVPEELRRAFHRDMAEIESQVVQLLALVAEGLGAATDALLSGDSDLARALVEREHRIDGLYHDVEQVVQQQLARQSPM